MAVYHYYQHEETLEEAYEKFKLLCDVLNQDLLKYNQIKCYLLRQSILLTQPSKGLEYMITGCHPTKQFQPLDYFTSDLIINKETLDILIKSINKDCIPIDTIYLGNNIFEIDINGIHSSTNIKMNNNIKSVIDDKNDLLRLILSINTIIKEIKPLRN